MQREPERRPNRSLQPARGELERLHSPLGLLFGRDQGTSGDVSQELAVVREARKAREVAAEADPQGPPPAEPTPPTEVAPGWLRRLRSALGGRRVRD